MRQNLKKLIAKCEAKTGMRSKRTSAIIIYNPEYPNFKISSTELTHVIAIPDNGMDEILTKKIGNSFVIL